MKPVTNNHAFKTKSSDRFHPRMKSVSQLFRISACECLVKKKKTIIFQLTIFLHNMYTIIFHSSCLGSHSTTCAFLFFPAKNILRILHYILCWAPSFLFLIPTWDYLSAIAPVFFLHLKPLLSLLSF